MRTSITRLSLAVAATVCLGACGVRGPLDPPPKAKEEGTATATSGAAADPGPNSSAPKQEHRGFILDGLIR